MQNAETGDGTVGGRAAEVAGKEGKNPNSHRNSTEAPPKLHRNITLTTPELPRSNTLAERLQQAGRWLGAPEPDGGGGVKGVEWGRRIWLPAEKAGCGRCLRGLHEALHFTEG
jgi:hypothetical protein